MLIKKMKTLDANIKPDQLQRNVFESITEISKCPLLVGNIIENYKDENPQSSTYNKTIPITLSTTPKLIPHKLGVRPTGFIVIDQNANATIWRYQPMNAEEVNRERKEELIYLRLVASAEVTVKLWVF